LEENNKKGKLWEGIGSEKRYSTSTYTFSISCFMLTSENRELQATVDSQKILRRQTTCCHSH